MAIDVTGSKKSFCQLSDELGVNKFGILDADGEWSYIEKMENGGFAWSSASPGYANPILPYFPEQTWVSPRDVESKTVYSNGRIELSKVIKVLAYDD